MNKIDTVLREHNISNPVKKRIPIVITLKSKTNEDTSLSAEKIVKNNEPQKAKSHQYKLQIHEQISSRGITGRGEGQSKIICRSKKFQ